jgi:serine/threonine protein phosphatase PrpC
VALFAEENLPKLIKESPAFKTKNYKQALINSFLDIDKLLDTPRGKKELQKINARIPASTSMSLQGNSEEIGEHAGCTACVVLITKTEIYIANAGDSRCVLSKNGIAINMSEDHKPELGLEKIRIEKAGGYVEDNRINGVLNLSRSLGDLEYKQNKKLKPEEQMVIAVPDVKVEKISNECDFLLLACDGIWDCFSSQEAVNFIIAKREGQPVISKTIEDMMDYILPNEINEKNGLGCDNMTCIAIFFKKIK